MSAGFLLTAALALAVPGAVCAQTLAPVAPPQAEDKAAPPTPRDVVPQEKGAGASAGTLSEQLSRSGGVIRPPAEVDRKIEAPTPNPGAQSTPVIPPPGTPGGNSDVKPK